MAYEPLMLKALALAKKGVGKTSPNPAVGSVVVKGGQVIAKGWHHKAGLPHAEIEALNSAGKNAKGSTLFVTLEPCCHFGKTPPCTDAIIASGI
ncbi:MAG TPA: bifunctional diaminohydroxyphosphoribosylaminopyrimidine deaminase/5-amino-6-(5-phosphoribosylamino)uracil reductase RibD, partial [Syntrophales bacterium]|nr:bifunctional diaminohydroxyphosphoribosylaminopyrimidine deaminase/5-amino-6-(5-phosphoribosylamino)uracil reductase RibD [Syntrophales bacterium]